MKISRTKIQLGVLATVLLTGASFAAQAQIMKCVGKDGRIEFASNCPPGSQQQSTGVGSAKPAPAAAPTAAKEGEKGAKENPAAPKSLADRDAEFRKRQTDQKAAEDKSAQKTADDAERQRTCQAAQSQLQAVRNRQRMIRTDPRTGERIVYEEADYVREQGVAERVAAENCK